MTDQILVGPGLGDADARWLQRVAEDVEALLGPGGRILDLGIERGSDVTLRCRYAIGTAEATTEARGSTGVEAHAALRLLLAEDRIGLGLRAVLATS